MKILVIAQRFPPDVGGACTRVHNAVNGLQELGHEIVIIAAFPRDHQCKMLSRYNSVAFTREYNADCTEFFRVWVPPLYYRGFRARFLMFLSFTWSALFPLPLIGKINVIWAANPNFFSMFPAVVYSLVYRVPIVRNVDDLWPEVVYDLGYLKSSLLKKLLDFVSKVTYVIPKAITPISRSYKKVIMDRYNIDGNKIFVIEHGVDNNIFHPTIVKKNLYGDNFVVMYSGKLGFAYDFDVILEAARNLSPFDDIKFVLRGFGERRREIGNKIMKHGLTNVVLDKRFVDKKELTYILNSAHIFIISMKALEAPEQGLPTKILEYQACGKPIICCSEGEAARYVNLTRSGLVIKPGDSQTLAKAILRLYKNRKLLEKLGTNGWKHVSQNLTLEKIGELMSDVLLKAKAGYS